MDKKKFKPNEKIVQINKNYPPQPSLKSGRGQIVLSSRLFLIR